VVYIIGIIYITESAHNYFTLDSADSRHETAGNKLKSFSGENQAIWQFAAS